MMPKPLAGGGRERESSGPTMAEDGETAQEEGERDGEKKKEKRRTLTKRFIRASDV